MDAINVAPLTATDNTKLIEAAWCDTSESAYALNDKGHIYQSSDGLVFSRSLGTEDLKVHKLIKTPTAVLFLLPNGELISHPQRMNYRKSPTLKLFYKAMESLGAKASDIQSIAIVDDKILTVLRDHIIYIPDPLEVKIAVYRKDSLESTIKKNGALVEFNVIDNRAVVAKNTVNIDGEEKRLSEAVGAYNLSFTVDDGVYIHPAAKLICKDDRVIFLEGGTASVKRSEMSLSILTKKGILYFISQFSNPDFPEGGMEDLLNDRAAFARVLDSDTKDVRIVHDSVMATRKDGSVYFMNNMGKIMDILLPHKSLKVNQGKLKRIKKSNGEDGGRYFTYSMYFVRNFYISTEGGVVRVSASGS